MSAEGDDEHDVRRRDETQRVQALEAFLEARGATWAREKVEMTSEGVVHGFGVVAKAEIQAGEELFRIPRAAAFGAGTADTDDNDDDDDDDDDDGEGDDATVEHRDSQTAHALLLLAERSKGSKASAWAPLWATLPDPATYADLPWLWPAEQAAAVKGTSLEAPVAAKKERLEREWQTLREGSKTDEELDTYMRACGVILSHLNPFFGGAVVPFVYMLNCSNTNEPNVEFQEEEVAVEIGDSEEEDDDEGESVVVGRAIRDIAAGEELTQAYGNDISTAELVYRCGFALPGAKLRDVIDLGLVAEVQKELARDGDRDAEARLLKRAGVVAPCAWDGLEDVLTVEVGRDSGITELRVASAVSMLDATTLRKVAQFCGVEAAESGSASAVAAAKAAGLDIKKQRLDGMDCAAVLLSASLDAIESGTWPPTTAQTHASALSSARRHAGHEHCHEHCHEHEHSEDDDGEEEEEEDEALWDVLRPLIPGAAVQHASGVVRARLTALGAGEATRAQQPAIKRLAEVESELLRNIL